jgi:hypothetical protein
MHIIKEEVVLKKNVQKLLQIFVSDPEQLFRIRIRPSKTVPDPDL